VQEHGFDLDPFIAEGGAGTTNVSVYSREFVKVRYMAERREVTDVATMVGLLGPNASAIAEETERGTVRLMSKVERSLFHADSTLSDLQYDGIFKQIRDNAPERVTDLRGAPVTPALLQSVLGDVFGAPNFGRPDTIYVEPRVHADLIQQSVAYGRHDQLNVSDGGKGLTFGHRQLNIMAPYGSVPIVPAPFLFRNHAPNAVAAGDAPFSAVAVFSIAAAGGTSQFTTADAGTYFYKVVAVGDGGISIPMRNTAGPGNGLVVAANDEVTITIADNGNQGSGDNNVRYYRVFRSAKDATDDSNCKMIVELPAASGNAGNTELLDRNANLLGTSSILAIQHDPTIFEFARLLDYIRRPLAEVQTTKPFLLMLFGSPIVKVPSKTFVLDNVGLS